MTTRVTIRFGSGSLAVLCGLVGPLWAQSSSTIDAGSATPAGDGEVVPQLPKRMWLRGGLLFDRRDGDWPNREATFEQSKRPVKRNDSIGRLVPDPVLVEVLDGGKLRARLADGRLVEGWRPRRNYGTYVRLSMLGLYAQEDTPLLLGPDRELVGRVLKGAFVPIDRINEDEAVLAQMNIATNGGGRFRVKLSALGLGRIAPPRMPESDNWMQAWGHELMFSPDRAPGHDVYVICAPARKLEDKIVDGEAMHRLAVYSEGIEVEGWAGETLQGQWTRCDRTMPILPAYYPRVLDEKGAEAIPPLEDGYVPPPPRTRALVDQTFKWFRRARTLYVPRARGWKIPCVGFKVTMNTLEELAPEEPVVYSAVPLDIGWLGGIELGHWETRLRDGTHMLASGWQYYQVVSLRPDAIEVISGKELRGYHPDDTEIWYRSEKDCKSRATLGHVSTMF